MSTITLPYDINNGDALDADKVMANENAIVSEYNTSVAAKSGDVVSTTETQTLTNKTLTSPKINEDVAVTATASEINILDGVTATAAELNLLDGVVSMSKLPLNAPQGFLINGKIVPSVASNNLTVAIKGMDGNDPSASNPVYCRIGDTVRSITSALSAVANAGSNWLAMGSSEMATKECDLFVYLVWNTTANPDQITLGFSRVPYARVYSEFYPDRANAKGMYQNDSPFSADTDEVEVIGRFAATLSAGAGYTWSVPTFTASNLIQRPIYETRLLDFAPQFTVTEIDNASGGQPTTTSAKYQLSSRICRVEWIGSGTKAGANNYFSFTQAPFVPVTVGGVPTGALYYRVGGVELTGITIFISNKSYAFAGATIADNATMNPMGMNFIYTI